MSARTVTFERLAQRFHFSMGSFAGVLVCTIAVAFGARQVWGFLLLEFIWVLYDGWRMWRHEGE